MNLAEIISAYMKEQDVGATELSRKSGVPLRTVNNVINGLTEDPRLETVRALASALGHSLNEVDALLADAPLYSAAAGDGVFNDGYPTDTMAVRLGSDQVCVSVDGRSMEPTLCDGDVVVVQATSEIPDRTRIALVKVDGERATLKRVKPEANGIWLLADNPEVYPPNFFTVDEVERLPITIEGVVIKLIREL